MWDHVDCLHGQHDSPSNQHVPTVSVAKLMQIGYHKRQKLSYNQWGVPWSSDLISIKLQKWLPPFTWLTLVDLCKCIGGKDYIQVHCGTYSKFSTDSCLPFLYPQGSTTEGEAVISVNSFSSRNQVLKQASRSNFHNFTYITIDCSPINSELTWRWSFLINLTDILMNILLPWHLSDQKYEIVLLERNFPFQEKSAAGEYDKKKKKHQTLKRHQNFKFIVVIG